MAWGKSKKNQSNLREHVMHAKGQDMGLDTQVTRTADVAAAGSAFFAGTAWFAEVEPVVTVLAGLVAIVAGSFAAWYHFERAIGMRRRNRKIRDT